MLLLLQPSLYHCVVHCYCVRYYAQLLADELSCLAFFTLVNILLSVCEFVFFCAMHMEVSLCALIILIFVLCDMEFKSSLFMY